MTSATTERPTVTPAPGLPRSVTDHGALRVRTDPDDGLVGIQDEPRDLIATFSLEHIDVFEAIALAHLFAAAPEMFETLRTILARLELAAAECDGDADDHPLGSAMFAEIRDLLRRANHDTPVGECACDHVPRTHRNTDGWLICHGCNRRITGSKAPTSEPHFVAPAPKNLGETFAGTPHECPRVPGSALGWKWQNGDSDGDGDEDTLLAKMDIGGATMHVQAIRVKTEDDQQVATRDPHGRLEDLHGVYGYTFETTTLPGFDGEWVVYAHPHGL